MDKTAIIARIHELAGSEKGTALGEMTISLTHSDFYDAAVEVFGGWDVALAEALRAALIAPAASGPSAAAARSSATREPARVIVREPHKDALRPIVARTHDGYLLGTPARWLHSAPGPDAPRALMNWPGDAGRPVGFADLGEARGLVGLSDDGRLFGWDIRLLPSAEAGEGSRRLGEVYGVSRWTSAVDRDALSRAALYMTVSSLGKVKTSKTNLLAHPVTADGTVACLVDDGDELIALLPVGPRDKVLLVSSNGYGIHFPVAEVRPMGLRAAGVIGMKLRGNARIADALVTGDSDEVVVGTAQGLLKRMPIDEFRPQSRAGLGLVAAKLAGKDRIVAAAGLSGVADVLITTDHGRCLRLPMEAIPEMGRPARGDKVVELDDGESVWALTALLPMDFGTG